MSVLRLDSSANVAIARTGLQAGDTLEGVTANHRITRGHKLAVCPNIEGAETRKSAQVIGYAQHDTTVDEHVHTHDNAFRTTDATYGFATELRPAISVPDQDQFTRFLCWNGAVGTRNYITALTSMSCSDPSARRIAAHFTPERLAAYPNVDEVAAHIHGTGCGMADSGKCINALQRVMWGFVRHPNHGTVLIVGPGHEVNQIDWLIVAYGLKQGPLVLTMSIQHVARFQRTIEVGNAKMQAMLPLAIATTHSPCPTSEIRLTLHSYGSDAWSGITVGPSLCHACDLLPLGGTGVLAETPDIYGAKHLLSRHTVDRTTCNWPVDFIRRQEDYTTRNDGSMDNTQGHGSKAGGQTVILDESLGAVAKAGATLSTDVLKYTEQLHQPGVNLVDNPDYKLANMTGQMVSGCNMVAFTSGRDSVYGSEPAPTIKITTNSELAARMPDDMDVDMDVDAGSIPEDHDIEVKGREDYDLILREANGEVSKSEAQSLGDDKYILWQFGSVI